MNVIPNLAIESELRILVDLMKRAHGANDFNHIGKRLIALRAKIAARLSVDEVSPQQAVKAFHLCVDFLDTLDETLDEEEDIHQTQEVCEMVFRDLFGDKDAFGERNWKSICRRIGIEVSAGAFLEIPQIRDIEIQLANRPRTVDALGLVLDRMLENLEKQMRDRQLGERPIDEDPGWDGWVEAYLAITDQVRAYRWYGLRKIVEDIPIPKRFRDKVRDHFRKNNYQRLPLA